ncbi:MAG: glucose-6-phosphate dehydrogenase [Candidatus Taylorbacteria bacterium]
MKSDTFRPTVIVIFGATGNLFRQKLVHALFDLFEAGHLPSPLRIVGFSRKALSHEEFRMQIKELLIAKHSDYSKDALEAFVSLASYEKGDIHELDTYIRLSKILSGIDHDAGVCMNKLFYLATAPELYRPILENLSASGLTIPCAPGTPEEKMAWSRVLVEKPFGGDQMEAEKLDMLLGKLFSEEQIFRIDHYLAKETIQNILTFRFSNGLFEPLWNRDNIDKVEIKLLESGRGKVAERGNFYDNLGALRDVGQNHLLSMLALVAMENPGRLDGEAVREARVKVLKDVRPFAGRVESYASRAQYEGYRKEQGVASDSTTETYFKLKMEINSKRWKGVPIYLEAGKELPESKSEIIIYFKEPKVCICPPNRGEHSHENVLTFRIQPNEGISILFWAKRPGFEFGLDTQSLSFSYRDSDSENHLIPDAYERVLFDCIRGDQTLFSSTDEVKTEWKIITPIGKEWQKIPLLIYKAGEHPRQMIM